MEPTERDPGMFSRPRIAVVGAYRTALGQRDGAFASALASVAATRDLAPAGTAGAVRALSALVRAGECEAVHLLDAKYALAGRILRRAHRTPVSVTLSAADVRGTSAGGRLRSLLARGLDQVFVSDGDAAQDVRGRWRCAVTEVPAFAVPPVEPARRALDRASSLLAGIAPGRLVIGMPWPRDGEQVRWFRDAVAPLLHGNPVCLLIGAPGARETRLLVGAIGMRATFRAWSGPIDAGMVAAAARCVDAFVLTGEAKRCAGTPDLALALAASGAPLVAGGGVRSDVLLHERSALVVPPGDAFGLVASLNQLLALPAVQRHYLGEGFAAVTLARFTRDAAVEAHGERFAAMVGRPRIPSQLRAA